MESTSLPSREVHADCVLDLRLWRLWAKWPRSKDDRSYHPVLCHMVDVASVTRLMWTCALTPRQRAHIAIELGVSEQDAEVWAAFWAGLHDLGKASPAFQTQLAGVPGREFDADLIAHWLAESGLSTSGAKWAPHGAISLILMEDVLPDRFHCAASLVERVAALVGAHHGLFFTPKQLEEINRPELVGDDSWAEVQVKLAELLAAALRIPPHAPQGQLTPGNAVALAGLISVADWIGSNAVDFRPAVKIAPVPTPPNFAAYVQHAAQQAKRALKRVAWDHVDLRGQPRDFAHLFPKNPVTI